MKKIKCTIIQDILPLYIDDVVSLDTKEMVEEHLQYCEVCRKEYESMKQEIYIPIENKSSILNKMNKAWRKKKVRISILSILATTMMLVATFWYVFYNETVIPYSEDLVNIEVQDNHLVSRYYGKSYAGFNGAGPFSIEINGEVKNVAFLFYTETIADSPSRNLINNEKEQDQEYTFQLFEVEEVDAVYYADFDIRNKDSWDSVLESAVLIWER